MNSQFENGLHNLADHAAHGEVTLNADEIRGAVRRRQNVRRAGQIAGGTLAVAALTFGAVQVSGSFRDELPAAPVPSPTAPAPETSEVSYPQLPTPEVDPYWGEAPDYILDPSLYPDAVVEGLLTKDQVDEFFGDFTASANLSADPLDSTGDWDYQVADITDEWLLLTYAYIEPPEDDNLTQQLVEGDPQVVSVNRQTGETHVLAVFPPLGEDAAHSFNFGHITAAISGDNALWYDPSNYSLLGTALDGSAETTVAAVGETYLPVIDRCTTPHTVNYYFTNFAEPGNITTFDGVTIDANLVAEGNPAINAAERTVALCASDGAAVTTPQLRYDEQGELLRVDGTPSSWNEVSFRAVLDSGTDQIALHTMRVPNSSGFLTFGALTPDWFALEVSVSEGTDYVRFVVDRSTGLLYTATGSDWRTQDTTTDPVTPPATKVVPATSQTPQTATISLAELPGANMNEQLLYLAQTPLGQWTAGDTPIVVSGWNGTAHQEAIAWALDPVTHEVLWTNEGIGQCFYLEGGTQLLCSAPQHGDFEDGITWDYSDVYLVNTRSGDSQQVATVNFMVESVTQVDGEYILAGSSRGFDGTNDYARMGAVRGTLNNPSSVWTALSETYVMPELPERWATYSVNSSVVWVGDAYYFALFDAKTGEVMPYEVPSTVQALADGTYLITDGDEGAWQSRLYDSSHNLVKSFEHADADLWEFANSTSSVFVIGNTWYDSATGEPLGKLSGAGYLETDPDGVDYWVDVSDDAFYSRHQRQDFNLVNRHSPETGNLLWSSDVTDVVWKLVADSSDEAVIVATEEDLIALSVTDGTELWRERAFQPVLRYGAKAEMVGANLAVIDGTQDLKVLNFPVK